MWFLAQKIFSAKSIKKWLKNGHKTLSRPKKEKNLVYGPENFFSQIGQKMAKSCFLGPERLKMCFLAKIWLNGQRMFSMPKKSKRCGFWPRKIFQPNQSKNGRKMVKSCFLGLKRFQIVVFGPENFFGQISQKMAKKW